MTAAVAAEVADSESALPTRIEVELRNGHARMKTLAHGGLVAARPLRTKGAHVRIALVGIRMALLGGDELNLEITVGAGVTLEIVETTGLVGYDARGESARWHADITVGESARFIWRGAPFVAAQGSNVHRFTEVSLASGAAALVEETLVLGRSGETGVRLHNRADVAVNGEPLLSEELVLDDVTRRLPGMVFPAKAMTTLTAAGWRPDGDRDDPHRLDLAGEGALCRAMGPAMHETEDLLQPVLEDWRQQLLAMN